MVTQTMTALMEKIAGSKAGVAALAEMESERLAKRKMLADGINGLVTAAEGKRPKLQQAVEAAMKKVEAALESVLVARQGVAMAQAAVSANSPSTQVMEAELRQTADHDTIKAFVAEMEELLDRIRDGDYSISPTIEKDRWGVTRLIKSANADQVAACSQQVRDIRGEARDQVPLEALTRDELYQRLSTLRDKSSSQLNESNQVAIMALGKGLPVGSRATVGPLDD